MKNSIQAIKFLRKKEWSMANGQCPECDGQKPFIGWWTQTMGHKENCALANALESLGVHIDYEQLNPERVIRFESNSQGMLCGVRWCDENKQNED